MTKDFKKAFIGYKPKDVERRMALGRLEFEKVVKHHHKEITILTEENQRIKEELDQVESQMADFNRVKRRLEEILYQAHVDACYKLYETGERFDDILRQKTEVLKNQQDKNIKIKASTNSLLTQLESIIGG